LAAYSIAKSLHELSLAEEKCLESQKEIKNLEAMFVDLGKLSKGEEITDELA
jgi:hypothetical protein